MRDRLKNAKEIRRPIEKTEMWDGKKPLFSLDNVGSFPCMNASFEDNVMLRREIIEGITSYSTPIRIRSYLRKNTGEI